MKTIFQKVLAAIKSLFSSDGQVSSKRVFGAIMLIWTLVLVTVGNNHQLLREVLYLGTSLISIETVVSIIKAVKGNDNTNTSV